MKKKGQLTLFIVLGIIIVAVVLVYFLTPSLKIFKPITSNPEQFISSCVQESFEEAEKNILQNNGFPNQNFSNFIIFKSEKIPYQCISSEFYSPCTPQYPAFFNQVRERIENKLTRDVDLCFIELEESFKSRGYSVSKENTKLNLTLNPDHALIKIKKNLVVTKEDSSTAIDDFEFREPTPLYDLLKTLQTIVNYETFTCEFNEIAWMNSIREIKITRTKTSDQSKVYTLSSRYQPEKEIKFAIKTCVLPAGI